MKFIYSRVSGENCLNQVRNLSKSQSNLKILSTIFYEFVKFFTETRQSDIASQQPNELLNRQTDLLEHFALKLFCLSICIVFSSTLTVDCARFNQCDRNLICVF